MNIIKYNRNDYNKPAYLWTDEVTAKELKKAHEDFNKHLNENPEDMQFKDWLEMEQYFEQAFAVKK